MLSGERNSFRLPQKDFATESTENTEKAKILILKNLFVLSGEAARKTKDICETDFFFVYALDFCNREKTENTEKPSNYSQ